MATKFENPTIDTSCVTLKKRGRKSKKDIEIEKNNNNNNKDGDNINVIIEETSYIQENNITDLFNFEELNSLDENISTDVNTFLTIDNIEKPVAKKRGRKPKGGKIIQQIVPINNSQEQKPNIILHLKCSLKDLHTNTLLNSDVQSYIFSNLNQLSYDILNDSNLKNTSNNINANNNNNINNNNNDVSLLVQQKKIDEESDCDEKVNKDNDIKEIWKKLKVLEHNLHINNICDKKSACFWCTYEFDNPPVYIPKHYIKETYHVYGCFCSPECATAFLMEESIDSSSKFERYYLINHIYSKIYDYNKNIKPAPNPYYMLEKFYGNLSIQEYRSLLRNERLFLIVDKPLTRILPELHEDNDDFIINNKIIPSNTYQIKKKLQRKVTKNNILSERFGLSQQ
jgi:hypothetical protein